jgi:hypothetical protein
MTLNIDFHEVGLAVGLKVIKALDFHFKRVVPHRGGTQTIVSGIESRAMKRRNSMNLTEGALKRDDIGRVIAHAILAQDGEQIRFGLEGQDRAASVHQSGKQKRIESDVRTHVDNLHAGPNESLQQDRFIATHPTKPVQTKGNQAVQGSGAHPSIPNIDLAAPKRGVIKVVKEGRDHGGERLVIKKDRR